MEKKERKKEQMIPLMYIPYQLLLILLTYLFYSVIVREIVVVSLRWFKNPSEWRRTSLERKKEGKKEQMVPVYSMYIPIVAYPTYLFYSMILREIVKSSLFL